MLSAQAVEIDALSEENVKLAYEFWRRNPVRYLVDRLDVKEEHVWEGVTKIAESVRDYQKTCVEAGHSVSKDYTASRVALQFLECYGPHCTVVVTGPGNNQVENVFFREVSDAFNAAKRANKPLLGKLTSCKLDIDDKWFMIGFVSSEDAGTDENTRFQGFHNEYVLVIVTEAAGVPVSVWKAIDGLIITPKHRLLVYGNPTKSQGPFADAAQDPSYHYINISVLDTPNYKEGREVIPGVSGKPYVDSIITKYGIDSNEYKIRVLGRRPEYTIGTFLGKQLAEAEAQGRIGDVDFDPALPVYTFSDIGDMYSAWIFAQFPNNRPAVIDFFYDANGIGFRGYALMLQERRYRYGGHYSLPDIFPNGSNQKSSHTGQYTITVAEEQGISFERIDIPDKDEQVRIAQDFIGICHFSKKAQECVDGLKDWRKRKNEQLSTPDKPIYNEEPLRTWGRHVGDAICGLATQYRFGEIGGKVLGYPVSVNTDPRVENEKQQSDYSPLSLGALSR